MAEQTSRLGRGWIVGITVAVVLIGLFFFLRSEFHGAVAINVAQVQYQDIRSTVSTNAKVQPIEDFQARASAPGVVARLFVHVGEKVVKGQELLQMDDSEARNRLATAQASLTSNEATLKNMQSGGTQDELLSQKADLASAETQESQAASALTAIQALQAKGAASPNEVAAASQKLQSAHARVADLKARRSGRYGSTDLATQQAQLANARVGVQTAQDALSNVDIRSPLVGTVYYIPVAQYDFVGAADALVNVADLTRLRITAYFDEPDIGKLKVGQSVRIVWEGKPNEEWHGRVQIAPTTVISYGTRNVGECIITVDDANGDLLPNTNVTVTVTTQQKAHALSVPREALHTEGLTSYIYKVVNNHLQKVVVQVGLLNMNLVEITAGLNEGDTVALGATTEAELSDGLEVKAQP
jgi:HlyD family secretion protein